MLFRGYTVPGSNVEKGVYKSKENFSLPYAVIGDNIAKAKFFNFIVIHDIFDNFETDITMYEEICKKFPGIQVY